MTTGSPQTSLRVFATGLLVALAACGAEAQSADPHTDLVAALAPEDELAAQFRQMVEVEFPASLRAEPDVAALERECPGTIDSMVAAAQPLMRARMDSFVSAYRTALEDLLAAEMPAADAREAADFYVSDLGRRMMAARRAPRKHDNAELSVDSNPSGRLDQAALVRDETVAADAGNAALSAADRAALDAAFEGTDWGRTMRRLRSAISGLQLRVYNSSIAGQQPAIETAIERAGAAQLARCE